MTINELLSIVSGLVAYSEQEGEFFYLREGEVELTFCGGWIVSSPLGEFTYKWGELTPR